MSKHARAVLQPRSKTEELQPVYPHTHVTVCLTSRPVSVVPASCEAKPFSVVTVSCVITIMNQQTTVQSSTRQDYPFKSLMQTCAGQIDNSAELAAEVGAALINQMCF